MSDAPQVALETAKILSRDLLSKTIVRSLCQVWFVCNWKEVSESRASCATTILRVSQYTCFINANFGLRCMREAQKLVHMSRVEEIVGNICWGQESRHGMRGMNS